ncbi:hypothetical protein COO60DRAFT_118818 [Scenedesmus sp. NREL 46B-D3]|nr:hypothetical protein COO60DRAFT_118818 [Scenedesmus sp. NREL 46B-D3]
MHALPGSRIQSEQALKQNEQPNIDDGLDGTYYDSQNWEEMTSLLSFDGEEHKYVMRHMPGAGVRVEDMFASFDGDNFEAVMTAAVSSSEPHAAARAAAKPVPVSSGGNSNLGSSGEPEDLYVAVSRRRAAAMAAEAANKQGPKPMRRQAPLGSRASDVWMFQVPVNTHAAGQMNYLSLEQQYEAAQRALLPALELASAAEAAVAGATARQKSASVGSMGRLMAAAAIAAALQAAKEQQVQQHEVATVVGLRPHVHVRHAHPAPHAAHAQPAGQPHQLLPNRLNSNCSNNSSAAALLQLNTTAAGQARPAASAPEARLGTVSYGAVTAATQQRQPGQVRSYSSRVLSAAPVLLAPLVAATAEMVGAAHAAGQVHGATAQEAAADTVEAGARLPALAFKDGKAYKHELCAVWDEGGSSSSKAGHSCRAASASEAGDLIMCNSGDTVGGLNCLRVRQPAVGRAALQRALLKLTCSLALANSSGTSNKSSIN